MRSLNRILTLLVVATAAVLTGCHDDKSYAELLDEENRAANAFLVNQHVVGSVPENNEFEVGINAPYYQLDEDGFVFMQVLNAGTKGNNAEEDQQIYFRFTRYSLKNYTYDGTSKNTNGYYGQFTSGEGNSENVGSQNTFFRFKNQTSPSSTQWGEGIQLPLEYLPIDCEVNLVIKSQMGWTKEQTYVIPYFYNVRYFKSQI